MKPIHVYQCKADCCTVREPSKRFWYIRTPSTLSTHTSFRGAIEIAQQLALGLPQEVTA